MKFKEWLLKRENLMGDFPDEINNPKKGIPGYPGTVGGMGGKGASAGVAPARMKSKMKSKMKK